MLVFSLFPVDFNETARTRASPSCWIDSWSHAWSVALFAQKRAVVDCAKNLLKDVCCVVLAAKTQ